MRDRKCGTVAQMKPDAMCGIVIATKGKNGISWHKHLGRVGVHGSEAGADEMPPRQAGVGELCDKRRSQRHTIRFASLLRASGIGIGPGMSLEGSRVSERTESAQAVDHSALHLLDNAACVLDVSCPAKIRLDALPEECPDFGRMRKTGADNQFMSRCRASVECNTGHVETPLSRIDHSKCVGWRESPASTTQFHFILTLLQLSYQRASIRMRLILLAAGLGVMQAASRALPARGDLSDLRSRGTSNENLVGAAVQRRHHDDDDADDADALAGDLSGSATPGGTASLTFHTVEVDDDFHHHKRSGGGGGTNQDNDLLDLLGNGKSTRKRGGGGTNQDNDLIDILGNGKPTSKRGFWNEHFDGDDYDDDDDNDDDLEHHTLIGGPKASSTGNGVGTIDLGKEEYDDDYDSDSHTLIGGPEGQAVGNGAGTISSRNDIIDQEVSQEAQNLNANLDTSVTGNAINARNDIIGQDFTQTSQDLNENVSASAVGNQIISLDNVDDDEDLYDHSKE
ncbi:hypothetical protein BST61_g10697 [Cercospora zeina]